MKSLFYSLLALAVFSQTGCSEGSSNEQVENQLRDSVFLVHDEVMPKMGELNRLQRELKKISSAEAAPDSAAQARIAETVLYLEKAEEGMMRWMTEFKQPASMRSSSAHEDIMSYLRDEQKKVQQVKEDMLGSIEAGKALLDSLKTQ